MSSNDSGSENENNNANENENLEENRLDNESENIFNFDVKNVRRTKPQLDFKFFYDQNEDGGESRDKLWDLFLDIGTDFPTLEEMMVSTHETNLHIAARKHLDTLLCQLRAWTQKEYKSSLSLKDFAQRVEKESGKLEFFDYRTKLIHKYKTTNWKKEAEERKLKIRLEKDKVDLTKTEKETNHVFPPPPPVLTKEQQEHRRQLLEIQKKKLTQLKATSVLSNDILEQRKKALEKQKHIRQKLLENAASHV